MKTSPVAIFTYRRPIHTKRLIESLKKNHLIGDTEIHVFSDGIKNPSDPDEIRGVQEVRDLCSTIDFCKKLHLNFSDTNKGLAKSIIEGVSSILSVHDRIIVLEDDLVLSPAFLEFMNQSLEKYKNNDQVFHVSGYWFPVPGSEQLPSTFFYNTASCWGWGTWARAWKHFEIDPVKIKEKIQKKDPRFKTFNLEGRADFLKQLDFNIEGKLRTWAIKWYGSMFINGGLSLHPNRSYVNNIGHDGTGENCGTNSIFEWKELEVSVNVQDIELIESEKARKMMIEFYRKKNFGNESLIGKIKRKMPAPIKSFIKKNILNR